MATKVKIITCMSGATRTYYPGEIVSVADALAAKWIAEGAAVALVVADIDGLQTVLDAKLETVTGDNRIKATADEPNKDIELSADITRYAVTPITVAGAIGASAEIVAVNNAEAIAVTLPKAATANTGKAYLIKNIGAGAATITPDTTDKIDGAASLELAVNGAAVIASNGSDGWYILSKYMSS